jgi:uncharacterized membrane protein
MPSGKTNKKLRKNLMADQLQPHNIPQQVFVEQRGEIHSGPIPDPETLERYKGADPSFPERIMKMAEAHNAADVKAKNRITLANLIVPIIGQTFTLALTGGGIVACVLLAMAGYTGPAIASVITGFTPIIIGAFRNFREKP